MWTSEIKVNKFDEIYTHIIDGEMEGVFEVGRNLVI